MVDDIDRLNTLLPELLVPADFSRYDNVTEADIIIQLEEWKGNASNALSELKDILLPQDNNSTEAATRIVAAVAVFDGSDAWIDGDMRGTAQELLHALRPMNRDVVERVLSHHVKPLFLASPHPSLNLSTGRTLPRTAGGSMAMQDYYEEQVWKTHPGTGNLVSWCVRHVTTDSYEYLWHLLIPPVMTLLDDYQAPYKLKGVEITSEMLKNVPKELLKRTGVGQLLQTSLSTTLSHLHDETTPELIRRTVPVLLVLIDITTMPNSADRFERQCHLLGESIIGGIWTYASRDPDTIEASFDVLPDVMRALGIGSIRYLKALIPQCLHAITPNPLKPTPTSMQLSALKALIVIVDVCQPRIYRWKGAIIEGVGKSWVSLVQTGMGNTDVKALKTCLREVISRLSKVCPSVLEDEYPRLLRTNQSMFDSLLSGNTKTP